MATFIPSRCVGIYCIRRSFVFPSFVEEKYGKIVNRYVAELYNYDFQPNGFLYIYTNYILGGFARKLYYIHIRLETRCSSHYFSKEALFIRNPRYMICATRILFGKFKIQFRNYICSNQLLLPIRPYRNLSPPEPRGVKYYEAKLREKFTKKSTKKQNTQSLRGFIPVRQCV